MISKPVFKKDKFRKVRGNYSRWLLISCVKCKNNLLQYQKDGPGILKRLYLDRITELSSANELQKKTDVKNIPNLVCKHCKTLIGIPIVYEKEDRLAYRLFAGAVEKKIIKQNASI